ncbi:hypothetical protein SLEP1_g17613 [Rubroshorea leprosula]|uniref:Secreted protein n=1 Tax=Rubroshorea leprosula TaxID=152421 RepID=A0AAV5J3R0_9ROSI|nr:hypothetical protein SLEP1_g17613 [Rubroshorea leprosula]
MYHSPLAFSTLLSPSLYSPFPLFAFLSSPSANFQLKSAAESSSSSNCDGGAPSSSSLWHFFVNGNPHNAEFPM